jgi:hypothetical protein
MPVNNALTPEGSNALGAAFGYYPQLRRNRQFNDPSASAEMPLQFMRGRLAGTAGMPSDILNMFRSPNPMEVYGDVNYAPQQQVPYGSQELMQTLPLPPQGPAQQLAGNVGAVMPLSPAEILQAARVARQAALAGGKVGKSLAKHAGEEFNATLLGERPNTMLGAITPQPKFIFVGENSKTWNKADATKALEMEKAGASAEDIWSTTGTFRGPEGKLRQEISDQNLKINDLGGGKVTLSHPELQAAYEQLPKGVKVELDPRYVQMSEYKPPESELAWQRGEGGTIRTPANEPTPLDIYGHELQHAVQARENFASGGSPNRMTVLLEDLAKQKREEARNYLSATNDPIARQKGLGLEKQARILEDKAVSAHQSEQSKLDLYNQLAGEAEARAVQERFYMTPEERRAKFPYESYDVPLNQLIIRK